MERIQIFLAEERVELTDMKSLPLCEVNETGWAKWFVETMSEALARQTWLAEAWL